MAELRQQTLGFEPDFHRDHFGPRQELRKFAELHSGRPRPTDDRAIYSFVPPTEGEFRELLTKDNLADQLADVQGIVRRQR